MKSHIGQEPGEDDASRSRIEALLVDLLGRIDREGLPAIRKVLRAHPREAAELLRRLRLLAALDHTWTEDLEGRGLEQGQ